MYKILQETKELTKEFHHTNLVWLLEKHLREKRTNYSIIKAKSCHYPCVLLNCIAIEENEILPDIKYNIEKELQPLDMSEQTLVDNFKRIIRIAWSFGYAVEMADLNDYIKTGHVKIFKV